MDSALKPMLATGGKPFPRNTADWSLEPKFDGWRTMIHCDENGNIHVYGGRNGSEYTGQVPYLEAALADWLPSGTIIDGELIGPEDDTWGSVQGAMTRTQPDTSEEIELMVFDVTRLCLRDVRGGTYQERRRALNIALFADEPRFIRLVESMPAGELGHTTLVENGFEGSVWKRNDSIYVPTRSQSWLKFKYETSDEARITGFKPGNGEFAGKIGAIEFELLDSGVASRCSGMDMDTREEMTANQASYLGKIIEVKHNGVMRSGKVRHPQFMRLRADRSPRPAQPPYKPALPTRRPSAPRRQASTNKGVQINVPGASKRNYGAMGDDKLLRSIRELEGGYGEAVDKCRGGDPAQDAVKARMIAAARGLTIQ